MGFQPANRFLTNRCLQSLLLLTIQIVLWQHSVALRTVIASNLVAASTEGETQEPIPGRNFTISERNAHPSFIDKTLSDEVEDKDENEQTFNKSTSNKKNDTSQNLNHSRASQSSASNRSQIGSSPSSVENTTIVVCNLKVASTSTQFYFQYLEEHNPDLMYFELAFPNTTDVKVMPDMVLPFNWVWSRNFGVNYLKWPYDFRILSLYLLHSKETSPLKLRFEASPEQCQVYLGERSTTEKISQALIDLSNQVVSLSNKNVYASTKWCFRQMRKHFNESLSYKAAVYVGWYSPFATYLCFETTYDWWNNRVKVLRYSKQENQMVEATVWPSIGSLILLLLSPLILIYICPNAKNNRDTFCFNSNLADCKENCSTEIEERKDDYIYLDGESPVRISKLFFEIRLSNRDLRNISSRLRRLVGLLVSPIVIYIKIVLYANIGQSYTQELLQHKGPIAFLTILNHDYGRSLFVPFLGGPIGVLALYYLLGILFLVLPSDIGQILTLEVNDLSEDLELSPLWLKIVTIKKLSCIKLFTSGRSYCLSRRVQAHFLMIWRPTFWLHVFTCQWRRWITLYNAVYSKLPGSITLIFVFFGFPLHFVACLLEVLLSLVYYGFPMVSFLILTCTAIGIYMKKTFRLRLRPLDMMFVACILSTMTLFFFLYSLIFGHSTTTLARVIIFVYIAVIVHPNKAFVYVFFGTALLFYMYKLLSRIGREYNALLIDIVTICSRLQSPPCEMKIEDDILRLVIQRKKYVRIERIKLNNDVLNINNEGRMYAQTSSDEETINLAKLNLVHDVGIYCGIPKALFDDAVRRHKPLYIHVFKTVFSIVFVIALLFLTSGITNGTGTSGDLSDVMHVVFLVVMGALPHVLEMHHTESTQHVKRDVWLMNLEETVIRYVKSVSHPQE